MPTSIEAQTDGRKRVTQSGRPEGCFDCSDSVSPFNGQEPNALTGVITTASITHHGLRKKTQPNSREMSLRSSLRSEEARRYHTQRGKNQARRSVAFLPCSAPLTSLIKSHQARPSRKITTLVAATTVSSHVRRSTGTPSHARATEKKAQREQQRQQEQQ